MSSSMQPSKVSEETSRFELAPEMGMGMGMYRSFLGCAFATTGIIVVAL